MLRTADGLRGYTLAATDGTIGEVKDFYFDDRFWTVRYLVANTGHWLMDKLVLISPTTLGTVEQDRDVIDTSLTKKQIEESPPADSDRPVFDHLEPFYYPFYGWPPVPIYAPEEEGHEDVHLRSTSEVTGYSVAAVDGYIGHVSDFLVDDADWVIRYLVVDTRDWLPGKHVLISPEWIREINWIDYGVHVDVRREIIETSPEYVRDAPLTREYEAELCRHYGKNGYWSKAGCPTGT